MRVCKVGLGRLVTLTIESEDAVKFDDWDNKVHKHIPGMYVTKDGAFVHTWFESCDAIHLVASLKDEPMFQEEVKLEVWEDVGGTFVTKLHDFEGTLYDALLIAANEGEQYDV